MGHIRIGCQTYTWEMLGPGWRGTVDEILDAVAAAGYEGIEIATPMRGEYRDRPQDFALAAQSRRLAVASVAHASPYGFTEPARRADELAEAREAVDWTRAAGCELLGLGGAAATDAGDRRARLDSACALYDEMGRLALQSGVRVHLHPHSHHGSVIETRSEYEYLLAHTSPDCTWFGPDVGHMMRGGVDYKDVLRTHHGRLLHLHLKDVTADGRWAPLGEGMCDVAGLVELLRLSDFDGWLILEEESDLARADLGQAIRRNREYLRRFRI